jgi:hypothetical protein
MAISLHPSNPDQDPSNPDQDPSNPDQDPSNPDQDPSARAALSIVPPLDPTPSPTQLALCRRLRLALYNLGLDGTVRQDWGAPSGAGIGFTELPLAAVDRLVRQLEDLGTSPSQPWLRPGTSEPGGPEQLSLF